MVRLEATQVCRCGLQLSLGDRGGRLVGKSHSQRNLSHLEQ